MVYDTSTDPKAGLIACVHAWFALLADGRYDEACAQLDEPNCYGTEWTPEMIRDLLADNFGPETVFAAEHPEGPLVSPPTQAEGDGRADAEQFDDGSGYWVECDVPLNGEWSDLTAQFEFLRRDRGYAVVLHDLHVL